jgi:hypothetical protein
MLPTNYFLDFISCSPLHRQFLKYRDAVPGTGHEDTSPAEMRLLQTVAVKMVNLNPSANPLPNPETFRTRMITQSG